MVYHGKSYVIIWLFYVAHVFSHNGKIMPQNNVRCVILAGGTGERLWPFSKQCKPKQLLTLSSEQTLLEQAIERIGPLTKKDYIWVSTTQKHEANIRACVGKKIGNIIVEPGSRNTGPAILLSCMQIYEQDPDAVIVFLPADPFIPKRDWPKFRSFLEQAIDHASKHDEIVLFGAEPTYPATGYGYIEFNLQSAQQQEAPYKVTRFREKPSFEVAQQYLEAGNKLWNTSVFCARAAIFIQEFQKEAPEMYAGIQRYINQEGAYEDIIDDSIDYAVMERSKKVSVLPVDFSWCDVGNIEVFLSLKQQYNTLDTNFISVDAHNNLIDVPGKLVALVGVDDLCVVEVGDALLITKRTSAEHVRSIVRLLKQGNYKHYL